jgi:hypothetical protein
MNAMYPLVVLEEPLFAALPVADLIAPDLPCKLETKADDIRDDSSQQSLKSM